MLDLGVLVNFMSYSIYALLDFDLLKETDIIVKLANRTNTYPMGVVEDLIVHVDKMVFSDDFMF